jgi:hypothetical protein
MSDYFAMTLEQKYAHLCDTPSDINDALPVLRQYASKVKHVTEFGIRTAVSTTALLAAQPDRLISYDISLNHHFLDDLMRVKGRTNFTYHKGDTRLIDIEPTDFLFIDTTHTYEQLTIELARHANKVSTYIAMHDVVGYGYTDEGDTNSVKKGLRPAIEEFLSRERWENVYELTAGWGLMVLKRKPAL